MDDLIKSLQKGSADLMKGEDLSSAAKLSTFKQMQNETDLLLKGNLAQYRRHLNTIVLVCCHKLNKNTIFCVYIYSDK